jgi:hypothetical protein
MFAWMLARVPVEASTNHTEQDEVGGPHHFVSPGEGGKAPSLGRICGCMRARAKGTACVSVSAGTLQYTLFIAIASTPASVPGTHG